MDLGGDLGHLTYSTLVHPGDTWEEMWQSLTTYLPAVKRRICPDPLTGPGPGGRAAATARRGCQSRGISSRSRSRAARTRSGGHSGSW